MNTFQYPSGVAQSVLDVLRGWFTQMAIKHCGRDYGSELVNCYRFYRTVYGMDATQAWQMAKNATVVLGTR